MNILVLNYRDRKHPLAGGAEVHLHKIFGKIAEWGHNVTLFTTTFAGAKDREVVDGIQVVRYGGDVLFQFNIWRKWKALCAEFSPDIVVEDINKLPFYTPLYSKLPKFIQIHHLWKSSIFYEASFPMALMVWLQEKTLPIFYKSELHAAVSPSTVQELQELGIPRQNIRLIYNGSESHGTDLEVQREKGDYFIWLGRLRRYKGVFIALEAFKIVAQQNPDIKLKIAGSGPEKENIVAAIKKMGLSDRVEMVGLVSSKEKSLLLRGSVALIQSSYKEGWGLTVLEAVSCGTTTLASDVPGLLDSVKDGETGLLFPAGKAKVLAEKMLFILNDEEQRRRYELAARQWTTEFSWDKAASQTFKALQEVLA